VRYLGALGSVLCLLGCGQERPRQVAEPVETQTVREPDAGLVFTTRATRVPGPAAKPAGTSASAEPSCREQPAQEFLLRKGQIAKIGASAEERKLIEAARKRSIDYRTREYGYFPGFGSRRDNAHPPSFYAKRTKFMGVKVVVHEKVVPALACVEAALKRECADHPYQPKTVGGIRPDNTFKDYEVSNHVYGIAIDIDSHLNPCCHCVGKWSEVDSCKKKVDSPFERMAMPRCWVEVFERYGFYWLGHDELEDTMHFDFLGDPDRIATAE
jgi:hypothetical protein